MYRVWIKTGTDGTEVLANINIFITKTINLIVLI